MPARNVLVVVLLAATGCWADFPDSRFARDGKTTTDRRLGDGPQSDGPRSDRGDGDGAAGDGSKIDVGKIDGSKIDGSKIDVGKIDVGKIDVGKIDVSKIDVGKIDVGISCAPQSFVGCANSDKELKKCNAQGTGIVTITCGPSNKCDPALERCTECGPGATQCQISNLQTCSTDGLWVSSPCSLGCQSGKCCVDGDGDGVTGCNGDCNDNDKNVHPKQTKYFVVAIPGTGGYDYDCDTQEEKEFPDLVACQLSAGSCTGDGWDGSVPDCGETGQWAACSKKGSSCNTTKQPGVQACR